MKNKNHHSMQHYAGGMFSVLGKVVNKGMEKDREIDAGEKTSL